MKKRILGTTILSTILLSACSINFGTDSENNTKQNNNQSDNQSNNQSNNETAKDINKNNSQEKSTANSNGKSTNQNQTKPSLEEKYSAQEIEYARVWLQLKDFPETHKLNVMYKSAGDPLNHNEPEESANFPEDVTVLTGHFMGGGNVTYSSNGDGTINYYPVLTNWQENSQPKGQTMKEYTEEIANNPQIIKIDTGNDEEVEQLIKKIKYLN